MVKLKGDFCKNCILSRVCRGELNNKNEEALGKLIGFLTELKNSGHVVKSLFTLPGHVLEEQSKPLACDEQITYRKYGPELEYPDVILEVENGNFFLQTAKNKTTLLSEQKLAQILEKEILHYKTLGKTDSLDALQKIQSNIASTLPVALCGSGDLMDELDITRTTLHNRSFDLRGIKTKHVWIFPFYEAKLLGIELIKKRKKRT